MDKRLGIVIWDHDPLRIAEISNNLHRAAQETGLSLDVHIQSEMPYLSRMGMLDTVPLLEIHNKYWRLEAGQSLSLKDCLNLLSRFKS